jgi:histidyl-tRNA synthetase
MKNKPQTLKGFRDFLPLEKRKRDYVAAKIETVFRRYGFAPLETPTLEYAELLLGKYGDEADKLVYSFEDRGGRAVALRYDQTVPTARVLAQYQNDLPKYFRRYQIQNVFRADKPQKGRYREFTQCDCDIFAPGTVADAEILAVYYSVYAELGLSSLVIEINDRQTLLSTLSEFTNDSVDVFSLIQSIDKLDKLSEGEVKAELIKKGLGTEVAVGALEAIKNAEMSENLYEIVDKAVALGVPKETLRFNPNLARGLDYYTGLIFEGRIPEYTVGSVGGGGRYDALINELAGIEMPAVGFGIGFDRTVEAADQLGLIPVENSEVQVMVALMDEDAIDSSLEAAAQLRKAGLTVEVYPQLDKIGKQFKRADQLGIPYVLLIGSIEKKVGKVTLKNMSTGDQTHYLLKDAIVEIFS